MVILFLILAAVVGALYYFVHAPQKKDLETARHEASTFAQEAASLKNRVADLEEMLNDLRQTSAELETKIKEKEMALAALQSTQDELRGELEQEIADGRIQVERLRDQLRVQMVDEILFDSGETTLKQAGVEVLDKVGAVLKKAENKLIIVQGHTDNVPIKGRLAERFPTNWELSAARAVHVARFLQDTAGLDPDRLSAAGFSEYRPKADNSTAEGRQKNRRIEIVLAPLPEEPSPKEEEQAEQS
jgi:chemotaxis protein MotB